MDTRGTLNDYAPLADSEGRDGEDFRWRLRWACERVGGVVALAEEAGMQPPVLRRWLKGESEPSRLRLLSLARSAEVAEDWLVGGVGWHFPYRWSTTAQAQGLAEPEAFRQRIALLAKRLGTMVELGRVIGRPESTIRGWVHGPAEPTREMLVRLALGANVRLQWLLVGHEPITFDTNDPEVCALDRRIHAGRYDPLRSWDEGQVEAGLAARQIAAWRAHPDQQNQFDRRRKKRRSAPDVVAVAGVQQAGESGQSDPSTGALDHTPALVGSTADASAGGPHLATSRPRNADSNLSEAVTLQRVKGMVLEALQRADIGDQRPEDRTWLYETCINLLSEIGGGARCQERLARECATEVLMTLSRMLLKRERCDECKKNQP
ncbi:MULTISPECIES: helix-turn-helix transcriptional regulator [Thiorhodovibrio]|uniref:helix-turn-helix transcriptional regulator n=1 Tax=Thiorhodovibrio TaxID=61593 RepID=UPI00191291CB|nr:MULTISPECIES: helix-turn-helix transcriptional regulator [Thiorhodovibrio]MBK5969511.1 hypothetical protein [Thiorhodovibrio winogradskyi]WPL15045.1 Helix-turn-helix protein [Thiorhodovibrio litoralis]